MSESDEGYPWKRSFFLPATQQQFPLGRAPDFRDEWFIPALNFFFL